MIHVYSKEKEKHTYLHIYPTLLKRKNTIQVYEFFQCNHVRSKMRNIPLSAYMKNITMITGTWRTNRAVWFSSNKHWRRGWYLGLVPSWNHISIWLIYSIFSPLFGISRGLSSNSEFDDGEYAGSKVCPSLNERHSRLILSAYGEDRIETSFLFVLSMIPRSTTTPGLIWISCNTVGKVGVVGKCFSSTL